MSYVSSDGLAWAAKKLHEYRQEGGRDLQGMFLFFILKHRGVGTESRTVSASTDFDKTCQDLLQIVHEGNATSKFGVALLNVFGNKKDPLVKVDWGRSTLFTRGPMTVGWKKLLLSSKVENSRDWQFKPDYVERCRERIPRPFPALPLAMLLFRRPSDSSPTPFSTHAELLNSFEAYFKLDEAEAPLFDYAIDEDAEPLTTNELSQDQVISIIAAAEPGCPLQTRLSIGAGVGDIAAEAVACAFRMGQVLLYGPPGTGKSYWARVAALRIIGFPEDTAKGEASGRLKLVAWHPSWTYEDFVRRVVVKKGKVTTEPGVFQEFCKLATKSDEPHVMIIDEINRGNTVAIMGELLYALEVDKRGIGIVLSDGTNFTVPENLYILATANSADRSIAALDTALGRRFARVEVSASASVLGTTAIGGIALAQLLTALNKNVLEYVDREHLVGHAYLLDEHGGVLGTKDDLIFAMKYRIIPLLQDYCLEDFSDLATILGDGFIDSERQVVRKEVFGSWEVFSTAVFSIPSYL